MKRETGYYWIKHHDEWTVSFFDNDDDNWSLVGSDVTIKGDSIQQIIESKINKPSEYKDWIDVKDSLPKLNAPCLVKLVTDNKKRKENLNLPEFGVLGRSLDLPDEIIIFGNLSPFDGEWEVMYFKINPKFQRVTHWKPVNNERVERIKEYIDKFEKDNEKL